MTFDQFHPGQRLTYGPATISEAEMLAFANAYDPQWFHADVERARAGRWHGLIASGWHTCSIAMRLVVDGALRESESFGSPGLEYLKWLAPVRPGDALTVHAEVLDVRRSDRNPTLGVLRWRWQLLNQAGVAVLELVATSLFDLAQAASADAGTSSATRAAQ
jgi:acyl dehydratase